MAKKETLKEKEERIQNEPIPSMKETNQPDPAEHTQMMPGHKNEKPVTPENLENPKTPEEGGKDYFTEKEREKLKNSSSVLKKHQEVLSKKLAAFLRKHYEESFRSGYEGGTIDDIAASVINYLEFDIEPAPKSQRGATPVVHYDLGTAKNPKTERID